MRLCQQSLRPSPVGKSRGRRAALIITFVPVLAVSLGGCVGTADTGPTPSAASQPAALAERPATIDRDTLIGRWGVASFQREQDRPRVTAAARSFCARQPYSIAAGPNQGVMMHVADDPKLYELRLKGGSDGRTYLGFEAPPGDQQDRLILSASREQITMRFVDPDANNRYGTFIYVRCA
jgi:hypothetical protein